MTPNGPIQTLGLIPLPSNCTMSQQGNCDLSTLDTVEINNSCLLDIAMYLLGELVKKNIAVAKNILPSQPNSPTALSQENASITLELNDNNLNDNVLNDLGYTLIVGPSNISIGAAKESDLFYGIQTLLQLISGGHTSVPTLRIEDKARCDYRGLHLDVSRHFRSVKDIKHIVDLMSMHKMNFFHWHLVDDQGWRIEINKYPRLTEVASKRASTVIGHTLDKDAPSDLQVHSGFYTQQDIRDIVAYAQQRHITIIPEIDLPGHSSALLAAYPEYSCANQSDTASVKTHFGIFKHVLCNRASSFTFLKDLLSEVAQLFPSEYIHIGGDEVKKDHWRQCPDCQTVIKEQSLNNTAELQGYFIGQVVEILQSLGKKAICWDDVLESQNLNPKVTIMSWLGESSAENALNRGHQLIKTPTNLYFDFYQSMSIDEPFSIHGHAPLKNVYKYDPLQHNNKILGAQANVWTEYIQTLSQLEYAILPRMTALAEILWTPLKLQNWDDFKTRLIVQYQRFDDLGLNASRAIYVPEFSVQQNDSGSFDVLILSESSDMNIHYTLDGTRPSHSSLRYQSTLIVDKRTVISACCVDKDSAEQYGINRITIFPHKALNCQVNVIDSSGNEKINYDLALLTNGRPQQGQRFQHANWIPFENKLEFELELDLGKPTEISTVSLGFDGALGRELYFPESVNISTSLDRETWRPKANLSDNTIKGRLSANLEKVLTRYLRIKINNPDQIYSHEDEKMVATPLYIDEIVVT
ncbi:MAG: family 20 glycosylhydrolase [Arenicella sp.]|nr:family 20 glycosylhydrolase [Arenicella sp.]